MAERVSIYDMDVKYDVSYRDIKYPRLEFKTGELLLVLPRHTSVVRTLKKHESWIYRKSQDIKAALEKSNGKRLDLKRTDGEFKELVDSFVEEISTELDLNINNVFFRKMNSKWGSCSSKKNLTVNTLLKYLPGDSIKYVIYHEMVHLIERKHNERFWDIISSKFENHQKYEKDLLVYWFLIRGMVK